MHQLEAEQIAEGTVKHDAHAREYYQRVVNEWLDSPFEAHETPQMWLKRRNDPNHKYKRVPKRPYKRGLPSPPKPPKKTSERPTHPHLTTAPEWNGNTFLYVIGTTGGLRFTGYGTTVKPYERAKTHIRNLSLYASDAVSFTWFDIGTARTAKVLEDTLREIFPLQAQPIEGFKTEATAIELHDSVVKYVRDSIAQKDQFAKFMSSLTTSLQDVNESCEQEGSVT